MSASDPLPDGRGWPRLRLQKVAQIYVTTLLDRIFPEYLEYFSGIFVKTSRELLKKYAPRTSLLPRISRGLAVFSRNAPEDVLILPEPNRYRSTPKGPSARQPPVSGQLCLDRGSRRQVTGQGLGVVATTAAFTHRRHIGSETLPVVPHCGLRQPQLLGYLRHGHEFHKLPSGDIPNMTFRPSRTGTYSDSLSCPTTIATLSASTTWSWSSRTTDSRGKFPAPAFRRG